MRTLLIDDYRSLASAQVIARNYDEGIKQLELNGPWDALLLDHDLGSYNDDGQEMTGYSVVCWLEENTEYLPKHIQCVSSSPVGRQRINMVINKLYGDNNG